MRLRTVVMGDSSVVWGKRTWSKITKPRPPSLPEMRAQVERYQAMSKRRYMLYRGWPTLGSALVLALCLCLPDVLLWWTRPIYVLLLALQVFMFARWESSWEHWQTMTLPTDEQAQAMIESMREQVDREVDPFMRQIGNEAVLEVQRWITGERQDDDR